MGSDKKIDFRSDTFTRPSLGMYAAMAAAPVGDDVYGEDETVNELEARASVLLGKPAGLFLSSATQANLVAILAHCGRGEEVITAQSYHVFQDEAGGASALGGVVVHPLIADASGSLTLEQVVAAIKPDDYHNPISRLLSLENTVSGQVQEPQQQRELVERVHQQGMAAHLDGARLMNAAVALRQSAASVAEPFDSVMLCLSKGLGAPVGAMLCGEDNFIRKARRIRKMLGGGMRQAGVIAACGIYALEHNIERLAEDHANAARLAEGLSSIAGLELSHATNMVFIEPSIQDYKPLREYLAKRNILISGQTPPVRLVTHLDIDGADIERTIDAIVEFFARR